MSNIHGLHTNKEDNDEDDANNRYVGGIGDRGGGSGLAVQPNHENATPVDAVFGLAESSSSANNNEGGPPPVRRTITMYRDGFTVDDGPYRRLDDPANAEFLRFLAMGRTPRELLSDSTNDSGDVVVGLVDKRKEDYVETFQSFSGTGETLGTSRSHASSGGEGGVFWPASLPVVAPPHEPPSSSSSTAVGMTSVQVRMLNGKRKVLRVALSSTVEHLAALLVQETATTEPFRLVSGFPPQPLKHPHQSLEEAGLKGASVQMQKP